MRVLITGRGSIAQRHTRHLRVLVPDVQLAVISSTGEVDPQFKPCVIFASMHAAMDWKPEAVVIASVSSKHAAELGICLRLGLPCLAEKPLVVSFQELQDLRSLIAASNALPTVVVGCNLRYLPALQKLQAMLHDPKAGHVLRAYFEVGQDLSQWRPGRDVLRSYSANSSMGGGVVFDLVHEIDVALWLLGGLTIKAAIGGQVGAMRVHSDDVHVALLATRRHAPVVISLDYLSKLAVRRYVVLTDFGTFEIDLIKKTLVFNTQEGSTMISDSPDDFDIQKTYGFQMADWMRASQCASHRTLSNLSDAMQAATLMLEMKEAAL